MEHALVAIASKCHCWQCGCSCQGRATFEHAIVAVAGKSRCRQYRCSCQGRATKYILISFSIIFVFSKQHTEPLFWHVCPCASGLEQELDVASSLHRLYCFKVMRPSFSLIPVFLIEAVCVWVLWISSEVYSVVHAVIKFDYTSIVGLPCRHLVSRIL